MLPVFPVARREYLGYQVCSHLLDGVGNWKPQPKIIHPEGEAGSVELRTIEDVRKFIGAILLPFSVVICEIDFPQNLSKKKSPGPDSSRLQKSSEAPRAQPGVCYTYFSRSHRSG